MPEMEIVLSVLVGLGLAAACGFRVFVPLLVVSIASKAGHLTLAEGFRWIGSWPALVCLSVATVVEIAGYFIPWLDNLLDTMAGPAAVVAGIVVTAACVTDMSPLLKWGLALVAGGGAAGTTKLAAAALRAASSATTGGIANPAVSATETGVSLTVAIALVVVPLLAFVVFAAFAFFVMRWLLRRGRKPAKAG